MNDILLFLLIIMTGLSALLLLVSFVSWYRLRSIKLGLVSFAFVAFFVKAILQMFEIITPDEKAVAIDFIILVLLYLAVTKK